MILSSLDRLNRYISVVESGTRDELTSGVGNDGEILAWLSSVSAQIERYIGRTIEKTTHTEYFNTSYMRTKYFVKAYPVTTLTSVNEDSSGLYDGSEGSISDSYIGIDGNQIILDSPVGHVTPKGLQIVYIGGLAAHGVNSTFAISSVTGTWTAGKYVEGATSGAMGKVVSATATSIVIANLYGIFTVDDVLQEQDTEGTQGTSDGAATISSITAQSLAEAYPEVTTACEIQVRYMWKHKLDFENSTTGVDGTIRRSPDSDAGKLQAEARELLSRHIRFAIV